jgi:cysteinyl-tRNA synthetase
MVYSGQNAGAFADRTTSIAPVRPVRIKDTLSGELVELERGPVGIYACGPTVYSPIHVGNARPYVLFMLLRRFLAAASYEPKLVVNVTDINDKIYAAAREADVGSAELAAEMTRRYVEDTDRLGLGRPDVEPLASATIAGIIELIAALIERGHAYESGGDVYFRVRSYPDYGRLSNRDPDDMDQGEEAGTASLKEDRLDFALWKGRKPDEDSWWESPWGPGRPGWHVECSAMAEKELGAPVTIHGGGVDLVFPHHENEDAQTVGAGSGPLARIWMHNGMVLAGPEAKMAKSEGNVFQLSEAVDRYGPEAVIDFLISGHYRQPLSFGTEALERAKARNERVRDFFRSAQRVDGDADPVASERREAFLDALAEDFNTARAMAELYELVAEGNRRPLRGAHAALEEMLELVGLGALARAEAAADPEAERLAREREEARAARDFERADRLRDEIAALGFAVRDTPDGPQLVPR